MTDRKGPVLIELDDTPAGTASGFIGEARIEPVAASKRAHVLAIPATAILEGHGATANVYVVDEKSMTVRPIRIGRQV